MPCSIAWLCRTLEVSRSGCSARRRPRRPTRQLRRPEVAAAIAALLQTRPASYGYRRIHALLRRQGLWCNPKTVYALMRRHQWLASTRQPTRRPGRRHEGQVAVAEPNRRWASDFTWIKTWDGQKVRLAVIVDCADRMVLAWRCAPRLTADDLGEVVREALWGRFGADLTRARGLEFLSDHGPEYKATRFLADLVRLGLIPCHTPCRSPESNGIAEAFFGSFKRDYVYQSGLETVAEIERLLPGWIEDYNEVAPHSALGMRAPAQFYREWGVKNGLRPVHN